jgi:hypothetical protein
MGGNDPNAADHGVVVLIDFCYGHCIVDRLDDLDSEERGERGCPSQLDKSRPRVSRLSSMKTA